MSKRVHNDNNTSKKQKPDNYLVECLQKSGLIIKYPPNKNIAHEDSVQITRNLKKHLQSHYNYPANLNDLFVCLKNDCHNLDVFKHYLFPNIVRQMEDNPDEYIIKDSVIKLLLNIPILQEKIIKFIFDKAIDFAVEGKCTPWIQMLLRCLTALQNVDMSLLTEQLINVLHLTTERVVRLEIMTAIPFIMGDQEHEAISLQIIKLLNEDQELIPAVLDCLSNLSLSDEQYLNVHVKTLGILRTLTKYQYFPSFVKFLLNPGQMGDAEYFDNVQGLRSALDWSASNENSSEITTSQILTASSIRSSMISSRVVENAWMQVLSNTNTSTDCKSIDFIILLLLFTISEERQSAVQRLLRKQVKLNIIKDNLIKEAFEKYKPILKEYLQHLIELSNSLLILHSDPVIMAFASYMYVLMVEELEECRPRIVAELLQLALDRKQCIVNILQILNNIVAKDKYMLKDHSVQMLILLDRMDELSLNEKRDIMNLVCGLAYNCPNSKIRDDIHIIISKELGSYNPIIKIQGILGGVHAIKYLMLSTIENSENTPDDLSDKVYLLEGGLKEATQIVELIASSTKHFPDLKAFYNDEMCTVFKNKSLVDKKFLNWYADAVTKDLLNKFIIPYNRMKREIGDLKLCPQYCLNSEDDMEDAIAINIAELTLAPQDDTHISILSSLFTLVCTLHGIKHGKLSTIDALLGCAIIMPVMDIDTIDNLELKTIHNILDCLVHCVNWFRELLNAFSYYDDPSLRSTMTKRISQLVKMENEITQIIVKSAGSYKALNCYFNVNKYTRGNIDNKLQTIKITDVKDIASQEIIKTQSGNSVKIKLNSLQNIPFRPLDFNLMLLFNYGITVNEFNTELNVKVFLYLTKHVIDILENILISKIKKNTFISKQLMVYDHSKATCCAKVFNDIISKLMAHMHIVCTFLDKKLSENKDNEVDSSKLTDYLTSLEQLYTMLTIYFKWHYFKSSNDLLINSLKSFSKNEKIVSLMGFKELFLFITKFLIAHEKYCFRISTAISLFYLLKAIQELSSNNKTTLKILRDFSLRLLTFEWKGSDGALEKGLYFNQCVETITAFYLNNSNILQIKQLLDKIKVKVKDLKRNNDFLVSIKCFNKGNFNILYRNLGSATYQIVENKSKSLDDLENLELWIDVVNILEDLLEIVKIVENRNNLSTIFKKSLLILNLFNSRGIPIVKKMFKNSNKEILAMFKTLQKTTRFLQSLCYHSRLKKDSSLMAKVPHMKQTLENLIYKVKAILAANHCSQAFWLGCLKNKTIHGEVVSSQCSSVEESVEDSNDIEEEDIAIENEETDDDIINADFRSSGDILL